MRRLTVLAVSLLVVGLALPAFAQPTTSVNVVDEIILNINKDVDKIVDEKVDIDKFFEMKVNQTKAAANSAQAQSLKKDINQNNQVTDAAWTNNADNAASVVLVPSRNEAVIDNNSLDAAGGVISVNQAPGSVNNQGNATAVAMSQDVGDTFLGSEASAEKLNYNNTVVLDGGPPPSDGTGVLPQRSNTISDAFDGAGGIIGVNQAAGNLNNQDNAASVAVGAASMAALSEADLGLVNTDNTAQYIGVYKKDTLTNAFKGAAGIIGLNQSAGDMNNQANVVAVSLTGFDLGAPTP